MTHKTAIECIEKERATTNKRYEKKENKRNVSFTILPPRNDKWGYVVISLVLLVVFFFIIYIHSFFFAVALVIRKTNAILIRIYLYFIFTFIFYKKITKYNCSVIIYKATTKYYICKKFI